MALGDGVCRAHRFDRARFARLRAQGIVVSLALVERLASIWRRRSRAVECNRVAEGARTVARANSRVANPEITVSVSGFADAVRVPEEQGGGVRIRAVNGDCRREA